MFLVSFVPLPDGPIVAKDVTGSGMYIGQQYCISSNVPYVTKFWRYPTVRTGLTEVPGLLIRKLRPMVSTLIANNYLCWVPLIPFALEVYQIHRHTLFDLLVLVSQLTQGISTVSDRYLRISEVVIVNVITTSNKGCKEGIRKFYGADPHLCLSRIDLQCLNLSVNEGIRMCVVTLIYGKRGNVTPLAIKFVGISHGK